MTHGPKSRRRNTDQAETNDERAGVEQGHKVSMVDALVGVIVDVVEVVVTAPTDERGYITPQVVIAKATGLMPIDT